jgi:hypothetical protein
MLIVELQAAYIPVCEAGVREPVWFGGHANQLSNETIVYPSIAGIHHATKLRTHIMSAEMASAGSGEITLPSPASSKSTSVQIRPGSLGAVLHPKDIILPSW